MLWLTLNLCARIGCWILVYPALIISFTLLWGGAIISCHLRSLGRRAVLLLASYIFSRSLTGGFLFASKNVWIRWLILLLFFIGLFKFEIFWSYDRRANLLWWLKVLKHQLIARFFRVSPIIGCVRLNIDRRLRIFDLVWMSRLENPDFGSISNILIMNPLFVYRTKIDPAH